MARDPQIEEIRSRIDIVELIEAHVPLRRSGKSWKGRCPFHEDDTPSFHVMPDIQRYKCFGCGKSGDIFTFLQEIENLTFPQALERLAQRAGVTLSRSSRGQASQRDLLRAALVEAQAFFREQLGKSQLAREFLDDRGVSPEMRDRFGLGFAPGYGDVLASTLQKQGVKLAVASRAGLLERGADGGYRDQLRSRLTFPVHDEQGRIIGFGGRALGDVQPKYLNSPDTELFKKRRVLYAFDMAKNRVREEGFALLVEGYMDVIACHAAGLGNAVATLGTALSEEHATLLKRWCGKVVVMFDADDAGIRAALRAGDVLQAAGLNARIAKLPEGEDPDAVLRKEGEAALRRLAEAGTTPTHFELDLLEAQGGASTDEGARALVAEAVKVLAKLRSEVERDAYIERVARLLPSFRADRARAVSAVRRDIAARVRGARAGGAPSWAVVQAAREAPSAVDRAEAGLLRGACDPRWSGVAWKLLEPELFLSEGRRTAVVELLEAYPEGPAGSSAAEILNTMENDVAVEALTSVLMQEDEPLSESSLQEHHACLKREWRRRRRQELASLLATEGEENATILQEYHRLLDE
jgi:DNA primase